MNKKDLVNKIQDLFIVREYDGTYNLFGRYIVKPTLEGYYVVTFAEDNISLEFSTLRHAVTWCVFQKNNKYKEIKRIYELDGLLGSLDVSIEQHKRRINKSKSSEDKYIYLAKLEEDKRKKRLALAEINGYAELSKYWQNKKFQENQA
jgi:hypothetical protein